MTADELDAAHAEAERAAAAYAQAKARKAARDADTAHGRRRAGLLRRATLDYDPAAARAWALANGYPVPRGGPYLADHVAAAYRAYLEDTTTP